MFIVEETVYIIFHIIFFRKLWVVLVFETVAGGGGGGGGGGVVVVVVVAAAAAAAVVVVVVRYEWGFERHLCGNFTYILSPLEDALASVIIFITFISSRPHFTVTSSYTGPCSGFHHLDHFK